MTSPSAAAVWLTVMVQLEPSAKELPALAAPSRERSTVICVEEELTCPDGGQVWVSTALGTVKSQVTLDRPPGPSYCAWTWREGAPPG